MKSCLKNLQGKPIINWPRMNFAIELDVEDAGGTEEEQI